MMLLRIIPVILIAFFIFSCSPKQVLKEKPQDIVSSAQPAEEVRLPGPPQKPAESEEPRKGEPLHVEREGEEKQVILNFDNANIETVISTIGDLLNINYVITPGVSGKVTIQSHKKFPVKDLFQIFQTILEINGLTAVKDGILYRIVPIDTAKNQPLTVQEGKELKLQLDSSFITQIIPLEYVKANDILNVLRSLMPRGADLVVYEPTNLLIVTAQPGALIKFMKILDVLDMPATERESMRTYVYYVENGEAKKLVEILKDLYAEKKDKKTSIPKTTPATPPTAPRTTSPSPSVLVSEGISGDVEGEITITAYEDINGIIIKASPRSYLAILETLKKLDVPVKQVLIEVLIAEVTLSDSTQFGIEWMLKAPSHIEGQRLTTISGFDSSSSGFGGSISPSIGSAITSLPGGSPFASVIKPERFGAILTAFAGIGKLNVLASPQILAMDNKEANIQIGDEVPVATGLTQQPATATAGTTLVTTGQIQYKTIGTILTVKPHITEKDRVTLEITQEVSQVGDPVQVAGQSFQGFNTRKAKTTAAVQSGHTLVLGGLIRETKDQSRSGIPFLSKIPILGYLFSTTSDTYRKTELLLMVTPYVVSNQEEADAITREFKNKVKTIKERLEKERPDISENKSIIKTQEKQNEPVKETSEKIKLPASEKTKADVKIEDKKLPEQKIPEEIKKTEMPEKTAVPEDKGILTVEVDNDTSLIDVIEANGYSLELDDKEMDNFLARFNSLNENIKDIGTIPKGSRVRLPLEYLKKRD